MPKLPSILRRSILLVKSLFTSMYIFPPLPGLTAPVRVCVGVMVGLHLDTYTFGLNLDVRRLPEPAVRRSHFVQRVP